MAGSARYSEADRRGRNSNQDVTNIGVAGRRTGLRVDGARRGSDGFENESAFFSPTTTAKKPSNKDVSSAKSVQSATRNSGSYQDMDLEASSAQDVATTLRRRSEGPKSPLKSGLRRSRSPTKTHLNSPALRVRSTSRHPASPPKSALRDPARPSTAPANAKVARKLDFNRVDSGVESEDNLAEAAVDRLTKQDARSTTQSLAPADIDGDDEMAEADVTVGSLQDNNGPLEDVPFDAADHNEAEDDADPPFNEFINDQEDEPPQQEDEEPEQVQSPPTKGRKRTKSMAEGDDAQELNEEAEAAATETGQESAEDVEAPAKRKRGRPKKAEKRAAKTSTTTTTTTTTKKDHVSAHHHLSPSHANPMEISTASASPLRKWREKVTHEQEDGDEDDDGLRKSSRFKIAPLAFWLGEKVVYGRGSRRKSVGGTVGLTLPEVKEIIHVDLVPDAPTRPRSRRATSRGAAARSKQRRIKRDREASVTDTESDGRDGDGDGDDGEEEWEETITVEAAVRSFEDPARVVKKVLAIPSSAYDPRPVVGQGIFFQKTLSEEPHFAAGVLDIPAGAGKPVKPSKQNTMFFFIFTGYVQVKIHDIVFRLRKGGQFTVPRGNFYEILNVGRKDARLFFSQSTDTLANHLIAHPEQQAQ
ncbi:CENP-C [Taphrina deformans PYCC 5710]|uniref:CENP-C homolog n=1 Tax=Taphrina deformans (strain PYCC 5710 / ATCC 11124 / CBS 356.35 / IMI 108563 / JCM 9778 / NBRC 8474) TaxID=1097556 RepID=R4XH99_TAPDE|nr:CENP-C [Taphrina deformans PYCC 5710]|eukprot:CCG82782.1 CENP-C [Taphrina deformans PYCC 5710]